MNPKFVPVPVRSRSFPERSGVCVEVRSRVPRYLYRERERTLRAGGIEIEDQKPGTDFQDEETRS